MRGASLTRRAPAAPSTTFGGPPPPLRRGGDDAGRADPAEARKGELIAAALASLAQGGVGAVSVRDVARRAGVSPGLLRHHFGGFNQLLAQAYRRLVAQVDEGLDRAIAAADPDPEQRMRAFLQASFAASIVNRDMLSAWLGFWSLVRNDPAAAAVHAETFVAYRRRIEALLADLAAHRGYPLDVRAAAIALSAMLDGLWLELCLDPSTFTPAEGAEIAWSWVDARVGR